MFMVLCVLNFFIIQKITFKTRWDYFLALHPPLFFLMRMGIFGCVCAFKYYSTLREEKKTLSEIPLLIDFLQSYLQAGMLLPQALFAVCTQRKWCDPIQKTLSSFCTNYSQGKSFSQSMTSALVLCQGKKSRQYLCLLYSSLKCAPSLGENITCIIVKVKHKTQEKLNLMRKLKMTTAQMRLQALIILLSPLFLVALIYLISPEYILFFINSAIGNVLLVLMFILYGFALFFLNKIVGFK